MQGFLEGLWAHDFTSNEKREGFKDGERCDDYDMRVHGGYSFLVKNFKKLGFEVKKIKKNQVFVGTSVLFASTWSMGLF